MHISELETKMSQNSLNVEPSECITESSSFATSENNIMTIRHKDMHRESLLDDLCESLADSNSYTSYSANKTASPRIKKIGLFAGGGLNNHGPAFTVNGHSDEKYYNNNLPKSNGCVVNGRLDGNKKTTLLAALKHIDNGSSFEN